MRLYTYSTKEITSKYISSFKALELFLFLLIYYYIFCFVLKLIIIIIIISN